MGSKLNSFFLLSCFYGVAVFSNSFMERAQEKTAFLMKQIFKNPFLLSLANGTLSKERFDFYTSQDAIYDVKYADALAVLLPKTANVSDKQFLLTSALGSIEYAGNLTSTNAPQCPSCLAYSDFEFSTCLMSYESGLASVTPCYVVYAAVAEWLEINARKPNPYEAWIKEWIAPGFQKNTEQMKELIDRVANNLSPERIEKMLSVYEQAVRYELDFWESAWNLGKLEPHDG